MIQNSLRVLEYYRLLNILSHYAGSPLGRLDCLSLKPSRDLEHIEAEQRLVSEMKELLLVKGVVSLSSLVDLKPVLRKAHKKGAHLDPKELLSVHNLIRTSHQTKKWIHDVKALGPSLAEVTDALPRCHDLAQDIGKSITEDGGVSDSASPVLAALRSQRAGLRRALEKKLEDIVRRLEFRDENLISVSDGRYVVSVKSDAKNLINGIVHSYSRSRSTAFVEPLEVVDENNRLFELTSRERDEERKVLKRLTALVSQSSTELFTCLEIMGRVDGLFARAEFSRAIHGIAPIFSHQKGIYLLGALNPMLLSLFLESDEGGKETVQQDVIPIDTSVDKEKNILIISGPNRGGKTVSLKTIGLLALMAQAGMHIPAREGSRLGVFNTILAEIGDDQDISAGLSTFSARLEHLKEILGHADENSLVILDEIGTGTDPDEGASLAMAILDHLSEKGSLVAASTHFQRLKRYGLIKKRAQNASVEFDHEKARPTFRLLTGMPGVSHGIEIARNVGISPEIVNSAKEYLGKDKGESDAIMEDLAKMMEEVNKEKEGVTCARQELVVSRKRLDEESERLGVRVSEVLSQKQHEVDDLLAGAKNEFSEAIRFLKEKGAAGQLEATQRYAKAKKDLGEARAALEKSKMSGDRIPLVVGQIAYHRQSKKSGVVIYIDANSGKARIKIGNVKLFVDSCELSPSSMAPAQKNGGETGNQQWPLVDSSEERRELNLLGYTIADALPLVERMIDQAVVHRCSRIRIIHGIGSGTLRKAIRKSLKENDYVKEFGPGGRNGGNDGVTVVEL